jgi:hypothetical protein
MRVSGRRRLLIIAAGLVAVYAIAGFLVAPPLLRGRIEREASARLGREVHLARLRINPFALSITLDGLLINDPDGTPLLRWDRLYVDFAPLRSLWRRAWCFGQIHLVGAAGRLAILPGGALNIDDIVARLTAPDPTAPPAPPGPPPVIDLGRLRIEDASLAFIDRSTPTTFTSTLGPLRIDLSDFTTRRGEGNKYSFRGQTESGETFSWDGTFALDPLGSEGTFSLEKVTLGKYHPYYRGMVPFDVKSGTADVHSDYRVAWGAGARTLLLKGAAITLHDLKVSEHGKEEIALEAPIAEATALDLDLLGGSATLGRLSTHGGHVLMKKSKDGHVNLLDMLLPFFETTEATPASARPLPANAAPPVPIRVDEMIFADYTLDAEDLSPPRPARVRLDSINLNLKGVDNIPGTTAKGTLDLRWNGRGTLHADGDLSLVGLAGNLNVALDGIDVTPVESYVEPALDLRVTKGLFSARGFVVANLIDPDRLRFSYKGDARMDDFASIDGPHRGDFLSWRSVRLGGIDYSYEQARMRIAELAIDAARGTVAMDAAGRLNVSDVLRLPAPPPAGDEAPADAGVAAEPAEPGPAPPPPTAAPPTAAAAATDEADTRIASARISGSELRFIDRGMTPPVTFALTRIGGTLAGLSSRPGARAGVRIAARVDDIAPVTLEGEVDPLGADVFSDLRLAAQGIDLSPIGPYTARYLGYALDRGRLDVAMQYHLENRAVQGSNVLTANPFTLGAKTDSPDATHLPVRLGLALLRDRNGVVALDVPLEGSLDDPKFRLGRVILRALVNVFTKLVTSPFRLLARAFAGREDVDLSVVDFEPGSATLSADARTRLDAVTKGLVDRPGLTLQIAGAADPTIDTDGLRHAKVTALLQGEKWRSLGKREREAAPAESLTIEPAERPKLLKAAWKKFRDTHPEPADAPKPETPEEFEARLFAGQTVGPDDLSALAVARAQAVHTMVLGAGIETGRVSLRQEGAAPAARVTLELQ